MKKPLRVLVVEDSEDDALLEIRALKNGGYEPEYERVETARAMRTALREKTWDIIVCDYQMPKLDGLAAIALLKETGIDIPLIIVSGAIGEETAADCMRLGAHDYVIKGNLSRLVPAIERELKEAESRSKRRQAEDALRKSEANYRQLFDNAPAGIYQVNFRTGKFLKANDFICEYLGFRQEEIPSLSPYDYLTKESQKLLTERLNKMAIGEKVPDDPEYEIVNRNGEPRWLKLNVKNIYDSEGLAGADVVANDITERKRAEVEARERMKELLALYGLAELAQREGITLEELYKEFTNILPKSWLYAEIACARLVIGDSEFRTENFAESPWMQSAPIMVNRAVVGRIEVGYLEERPEGDEGPFMDEKRFLIDALAKQLGQIIDRKRYENEIKELGLRNQRILNAAGDGIYGQTSEGQITFINPAAAKILGYDNQELIGKGSHDTFHHTRSDGSPFKEEDCPIYKSLNNGTAHHQDSDIFIRKDGTSIPVEYTSSPIVESGKMIGGVVSFRDITERKKAAEALRESEQRFMDVLYSSPDAILLIDGEHFVDCNEATARMLGYSSRDMFLKTHPSELSPPTQPDGRNSFEKANEMMRIASERGFHQFEWEHRRANGEDFPVEVSLTSIVLHGKNVIHCMWRDLTERKRAAEELQRTFDRLKKAINTTIQVMVSAVEVRDPYTAGHQVRSANLARVIATEMGLPPNIVDGIRMAGSIHDIGKLSIPAEILSKPSKLTNIEFSLIKEHSRSGYEMLKDVESPWPLAEIVHQHHERMDGSGYPRNLKGDEILMEARILAVSDVVESMASHRPYRPALGIDAALEEIEKNRGTHYDNAVADACLRLFREKGYQLEGT